MDGAETDPVHTLIFAMRLQPPNPTIRSVHSGRLQRPICSSTTRPSDARTLHLAGRRATRTILNGDVFDFDGVTDQPDPETGLRTNWLERQCGLGATEPKSAWKMSKILDHHPIIVRDLRRWLAEGPRLGGLVGTHDLELLGPAVEDVIRARLGDGDMVFCEWFYLSAGDTLVEHGHQYDGYCLCVDPVSPSDCTPRTTHASVSPSATTCRA